MIKRTWGLHWFGKLEKYICVPTETPLVAIWHDILRFADIHFLRENFKNWETGWYLYVVTSIEQAYEYYLVWCPQQIFTFGNFSHNALN